MRESGMATRAVEQDFSYVRRTKGFEPIHDILHETSSEYELQNLWLETLNIKKQWVTLEGQRINILTQGYKNPYSGPDFKDALIEINGVPFRGDIEIHRDGKEWYHHGHHLDARYNRVLLHIVETVDIGFTGAVNSLGNTIPTLLLSRETVKTLPLTAGKSFKKSNNMSIPPCVSQISFDYQSVVKMLAQQRVMQRIEQIRSRFKNVSLDQVLYEFMLYGLGAGSKYGPMYMELGRRFPYSMIKKWVQEDPRIPEAVFLAQTGYLQKGIQLKNPYALLLEQTLIEYLGSVIKHDVELESTSSCVSSVYPSALPPIKLAWLTGILCKLMDSLTDTFLSIAEKSIRLDQPWSLWESFLSVYHFYWSYYTTWEMKREQYPKKLLGKERIYSLLGNIVIPFCIFCIQEGLWGMREGQLWNFFYLLPGENTHWILRRMKTHTEFLFPHKRLMFYEQQALIQWYKNGCATHPECLDCPLKKEDEETW